MFFPGLGWGGGGGVMTPPYGCRMEFGIIKALIRPLRGHLPPGEGFWASPRGKRSAVAVVNDSPVDCQSRDRVCRSKQLSA